MSVNEESALNQGQEDDVFPGEVRSVSLFSADVLGLDVPILEVEVHAGNGLPRVDIVGLADPCVRESKQRVRAAITASGWRFPEEKITINLAPASIKKMGTGLDLAMAVGILSSCQKVQFANPELLKSFLLVGELGLSGRLRKMHGIFNIAMRAKEMGFRHLILPVANAKEAHLISGLYFYPAHSLREVVEHLSGQRGIPFLKSRRKTILRDQEKSNRTYDLSSEDFPDLSDVRGQSQAKEALIIAACGGHNLLFRGPPGSGKTLLAKCLAKILPALNEQQALETMRIYSCADLLKNQDGLLQFPPFRAPHHSTSDAGLIGGGKYVLPGEISLAHNGVLFLDELPEFKRHVLEILREPLESGRAVLSRANGSVIFPARFQLLAAMNPCPCGYAGLKDGLCRCSRRNIRNYRKRISGPLLDRMDLQIHLQPVPYKEFLEKADSPKSATKNNSMNLAQMNTRQIQDLVLEIRLLQAERFQKDGFLINAHIPPKDMEKQCPLSEEVKKVLFKTLDLPRYQGRTSGRRIHRIFRVARTLADIRTFLLENPHTESREIQAKDIRQALLLWQVSEDDD